MAENTSIEWASHTFNPWRGCTKVSEGCKFCYADTLSKRNPDTLGIWGPKGTRPIAAESYWKQPEKWNREAEAEGVRKRVFCASLADVFEGPETMPADAWKPVSHARERLLKLIEATPNLDWLLLTKRPENVTLWGPTMMTWVREGFPSNVWIGTSVENQEQAEKRIPHLLKVPAKVRFLSCEPLIGPVDLTVGAALCINATAGAAGGFVYDPFSDLDQEVHWVITGGESGPNARPMHPDWPRALRDQCQAAGVPFFYKQWGEWQEGSARSGRNATVLNTGSWCFDDEESRSEWVREHQQDWERFNAHAVSKVGKKNAGRLLDGRTWDDFPEAQR